MNKTNHMHLVAALAALSFVLSTSAVEANADNACHSVPLGVQVLGSGGPFHGTNRASSSYLVWVGGRAVAMIDAGGGAFLRFGESGADLDTLSLLALSHFHPDHSADLPALLWVTERARKQPLPIAGPSGNDRFPGLRLFLQRLFDDATGAFQALSGTVGGPRTGVRLDVREIDGRNPEPASVLDTGAVRVSALPVPHADAPSLAYRIEVAGRSIVFGADQNGSSEKFKEFARNADVLVMHFPLSPAAPSAQLGLHALPKTVGQVATAAMAKKLVLSHFSKAFKYDSAPHSFSLSDLPASIRELGAHFTGPLVIANDLDCIPIP